jgi:hypothetical protein
MTAVYSAPMIYIMRLIHIVGGVLWVGGAVITAAFFVPSVRAAGPAGAPVMQQLVQVRKLPIFFIGTGFLTILSGIGLYWRASGGFSNGWMQSGAGMTFGIGGLSALIALLIGLIVAAPAGKRAGELGAQIASGGKPPTPEQLAEMQRLSARTGKAGAWAGVFLLIAAAAMSVARYVA